MIERHAIGQARRLAEVDHPDGRRAASVVHEQQRAADHLPQSRHHVSGHKIYTLMLRQNLVKSQSTFTKQMFIAGVKRIYMCRCFSIQVCTFGSSSSQQMLVVDTQDDKKVTR